MKIQVILNQQKTEWEVHPGDRLLDVLRRNGYYGVKEGCGDGNCGACVVLLDGKPVNSCLILAPRADGCEITTIEGLGTPQNPHPIQLTFADHGAVQCGFSTAGSILSTVALLNENANPSDDEIKRALDGNLCRCTGYVKKLEAIKSVIAFARHK
jgi:aerobic-type carbon monoxide dehydrogenase small subunit (CoxS/CutS family)